MNDHSESEGLIDRSGYTAGIPVNNLWLLMLYASDFRHQLVQNVDTEAIDTSVADLVADVLCKQVEERITRSLTYGYRHATRNLNRVRGKIKLLDTYSKQLLLKGQVNCTFEELSIDTLRNRYICSALKKAAGIASKPHLRLRCKQLAQNMIRLGVSPQYAVDYSPRNDRFGKHELPDKKVIASAELLFNLALISESVGDNLLPTPDKQETWVRKLFEKAVSGFYQLKLTKDWVVYPNKKIIWQAERASEQMSDLMPTMEVDIQLENKSKNRRIVIDTKFTAITKTNQFGQERFKRDYIFQIYSYLRSQETTGDLLSLNSEGMLLHPSLGVDYDEFIILHGHLLRFCTVDLSRKASDIQEQLIRIVSSIRLQNDDKKTANEGALNET